jgi:hypothetical protein
MFFSLNNAASIFSKFDLVFSGWNATIIAMFFVVMCCETRQVPGKIFFTAVGISAVLGLVMGLYLKLRTEFSSLYAIIASAYFVISYEIVFGGSLVAFAVLLSGRPDLRWFAFNTNLACMTLTLLIGMLLEARRLGLLKGENRWREEIRKYLDFSKRLVDPALTTKVESPTSMNAISMAAAIGVNIPLLFQIYGGGRDNAIFLAVPLLALTFSYINFNTFGPGLTRIFLLRKIEKEQGYRFQNADFEKIQELRRGFFLSRWLMKDYRPPIVATTLAKSDEQTMKKRKNGHK